MPERSERNESAPAEAGFFIRTGAFEGPLGLLLDLVERRKIFIGDIALASVADEYVAHLERREEFPVEEVADFLRIASTLLLLKSRALLPAAPADAGEREAVDDLTARLALLARLRECAAGLGRQWQTRALRAPRRRAPLRAPAFLPPAPWSLDQIVAALRDLLARLPRKEKRPDAVVARTISLDEAIRGLLERLQSRLRFAFGETAPREAAAAREGRFTIIVQFLALLELMKRGRIAVRQESAFGEIILERVEIAVPRYG